MHTETLDAELAAFLGEPAPTPTPAPAPAPAAADPLGFLDGINAEPKKKGNRKSYAVFHDKDGTAEALANKSLELAGAKEQLEANNKLLGELVIPEWFRRNQGKAEAESALKVMGTRGAVLVVATSRLKKMTSDKALDPVRHLIGAKEKDLFRWNWDLKIDGDEIPTASAGALMAELKALFAKHGATKALKVEKAYAPLPAFFTARHLLWTPEQNLEINRALPLVSQVKTKEVS